MKRILLAVALSAAMLGAGAQAGEKVIPVWNGPAPGSEKWSYSEDSNASERDKSLNLRNIVKPTITVYPADKPNGTGMLVIPGGGFVNLGYGKEGEEIARWLNSIGVTAFVLKYRLAYTGDGVERGTPEMNRRIGAVVPLATADAVEALSILRRRSAEWGLTRIGVMGFSAGGYLALQTALSARPDFIVPVYAGFPQAISAPANAPPAFIVLTEDDRYGTDSSLRIYNAWHAAHVPVELHIYAKGNHGFALRKNGIPTDTWNERLKEWMMLMGYLPK